jgi:hypothetical protein
VKVPRALVEGLDTGANLLNLAVWSLREQGLVQVEQLRPVEDEPVRVMGGQSFARVMALGKGEDLPGLEGALLAKAREDPQEGALARLADRLSGDDEHGLRGLLLSLDMGNGAPWAGVVGYCFAEARAAGLVDQKGLFRKLVITDPAAVEALRGRDAEIAAARKRYREEQKELDHAVIADCLLALDWAHNPSAD